MRKVISLITVFCFLVSNVSFAIDTYQAKASPGGITLSPPLVLDDIGDNTPHHKKMALAMMKLQMFLQKIHDSYEGKGGLDNVNSLKQITQTFQESLPFILDARSLADMYDIEDKLEKDETFIEEKEDTIFSPAQIQLYFNQVEHLGGYIFSIPISVEKKGKRDDYAFLFSTVRSGNVYPIVPCQTVEEFNKLKAKIVAQAKLDRLPERQAGDEGAIERYIQQEGYDRIIELAHEKGLAIPSHKLGTHFDIAVEDIRQIALIGFSRFSREGTDVLLHPKKRECYIIPLGAKIENDTIQNMLEKTKVTVVAKDGTTREIVALSHSSNNAIHIFLDETEILYLRSNTPEAADLVRKKVESQIAHELGVMCGFPVLKFDYYSSKPVVREVGRHVLEYGRHKLLASTLSRPVNEMDRRYEAGLERIDKEERIYDRGKGYYGDLDIRQMPGYKAYELVDLDTNLKARDYAMGDIKEIEAPVVINNIELKVPIVNNSLKETLKSLALNPDVLLTKIDRKSSVLVNGKEVTSEKRLKPTDKVVINYRSSLYFLRRKDNPDGQHFYRDNYPLTPLQIQALTAIGGMMGITTNLSIFQKTAATGKFNEAIRESVKQGVTDKAAIYDKVTMPAFQRYANLIGTLTLKTVQGVKKVFGTASYEVPPQLIHDVEETQKYQREITSLNPRTVMVKTPSTAAGFRAIRENALTENVVRDNLTLMFGFDQWLESQDVQIAKLEKRVKAGLPIENYFGVDSFFLSRTNMLINAIFEKLIKEGKLSKADEEKFEKIKDLVAIAQAKIVGRWNNYVYFGKTLPKGTSKPAILDELRTRFEKVNQLAVKKGLGEIRPRIPLWASTQVKTPDIARGVDPLLYFVNLIGPNTVNTMPDGLIDAVEERFKDMTDEEKKEAIRRLDNAIDDNRIILQYNPKGNNIYAEELTPDEIIALTDILLMEYTNEILAIKGTYPTIKDKDLEAEVKGTLPSIADVDIKTEIKHYNSKLYKLVKKGILPRELYGKERINLGREFKLDIETIAKILTWRGGYLFEDDYLGSLATFAEKINGAKEAISTPSQPDLDTNLKTRDYAMGTLPQAASLDELLSRITVSINEDLMGKAAAEAILHDIEKAVDEKGRAIMLLASAPSQHSTWKWLIKLWQEIEPKRQKYLRDRIIAFHMDEYLGLPENAKQLFGKVLKEMLFTELELNPDNVFYFNNRIAYKESMQLREAIKAGDQTEIDRLTKLVEGTVQPHIDETVEKFKSCGGKFDIVVGGIGKIPHLAFNDPGVADFNDPLTIKVVRMDEESRIQQVIDEEFETLRDVPTHALSFTLPPIFSAESIYIIVPRLSKAESVRRTLENEISTKDPASGLRMKEVLPRVKFFFDMDSIKESRIAQLALERQRRSRRKTNTKPGRSPEDAARITAIAPVVIIALEEKGYFTTKIYAEGYLQVAPILGLPLEAPSNSTILRDLDGVIGMKYLIKEKVGGENHYKLTGLGKSVFGMILKGLAEKDVCVEKITNGDIYPIFKLTEADNLFNVRKVLRKSGIFALRDVNKPTVIDKYKEVYPIVEPKLADLAEHSSSQRVRECIQNLLQGIEQAQALPEKTPNEFRNYSAIYKELIDSIIDSGGYSERAEKIVSVILDAYMAEVNGELEKDRTKPEKEKAKLPEIRKQFAKAVKDISFEETKNTLELLDKLQLQIKKGKVDIVSGLRNMLTVAALRREESKRNALQKAIERARFALAQGFTSFATDTSTLTLLEKEDVKERLKEVIDTGAEILRVIYEGAGELGIEVGLENEVGDIGKEISTVLEAQTLYLETVKKLQDIAKKLGLDFSKVELFDIIALNIGTAHGYDFYGAVTKDDFKGLVSDGNALWNELINRGYIKEVGKDGEITKKFQELKDASSMELDESFRGKKKDIYDIIKYSLDHADELKPYKPGRINVKRAQEVYEAFKAMGLDIGVALHGFSGTPIEFAKDFVNVGIAKVNINTDWQAIIWKVLLAYRPDLYWELFRLARGMAAKDAKKSYLVTNDENYDFEHARNRIMFEHARKVFRDEKYHPLLEEITLALKTDLKALPVAEKQEEADHNKIQLTVRKGEQWMTALQAIEMLTHDRIAALMEAMQLKDSAKNIHVDRKRELRLERWQIKELIAHVAHLGIGLKDKAELEGIIERLQDSNPEEREKAAHEFIKTCPDENVVKEFEAYYASLPISGKKILKEALKLGRPTPAPNIDNGELSVLQIRAIMTAALENNSYILFEVGPDALLTYAKRKPHLPEYCARVAYELYKKTGKIVTYGVHLDHNQIKAKDYYKGEEIEGLTLAAADLTDNVSREDMLKALKTRYFDLVESILKSFLRATQTGEPFALITQNAPYLTLDTPIQHSVAKLATIVFDAYMADLKGELKGTKKEAFKVKLIETIKGIENSHIAADGAIMILDTADDALFIKDSSIVQVLYKMLQSATRGENPAMLLLTKPIKSHLLVAMPKLERNKFVIEKIKDEFTPEELKTLISIFENFENPSYKKDATEIEDNYTYSLSIRLKTLLERLSIESKLPYKLPKENEIGGLATFKAAYAWKTMVACFYPHWRIYNELTAEFKQLADKELKPVALLEEDLHNILEKEFIGVTSLIFAARQVQGLKRRTIGHYPLWNIIKFEETRKFKRDTVVIPCAVNTAIKSTQYYGLVSFIKGGLVGDITVVTAEEMKAINALKAFGVKAFERNAEDRKAMDRYMQHERGLDRLLEYAHEHSLAQKPLESVFNYKETVLKLLKDLNIEVKTPEGLVSIENREFFVIKETKEIKEMNESIATIYMTTESKIAGVSIGSCLGHSSNRTVHIFVSEELFDALITSHEIDKLPIKEQIEGLKSRIAYEIGAMLGYPIRFGDRGATNEVYFRYRLSKTDHPGFATLEATVVDLNANLRTRDYAMAEESRTGETSFTHTEFLQSLGVCGLLSPSKLSREQIKGIVEAVVKAEQPRLGIEIAFRYEPGKRDEVLELIKYAREQYKSGVVAAGTVLNGKDAIDAVKAGARLIVTPGLTLTKEDIERIHQLGAKVILGVGSKIEAQRARRRGADAIKAFPYNPEGDYLKALKGPLPQELHDAAGKYVHLVGGGEKDKLATFTNVYEFLLTKPTKRKRFRLPLAGEGLVRQIQAAIPEKPVLITGGVSVKMIEDGLLENLGVGAALSIKSSEAIPELVAAIAHSSRGRFSELPREIEDALIVIARSRTLQQEMREREVGFSPFAFQYAYESFREQHPELELTQRPSLTRAVAEGYLSKSKPIAYYALTEKGKAEIETLQYWLAQALETSEDVRRTFPPLNEIGDKGPHTLDLMQTGQRVDATCEAISNIQSFSMIDFLWRLAAGSPLSADAFTKEGSDYENFVWAKEKFGFEGDIYRFDAFVKQQPIYDAILKRLVELRPAMIESEDLGSLKAMREAVRSIPQEYNVNGFNRETLVQSMISLLSVRPVFTDNSALIFSEKVTFDNGLGILLPKIAKSGMKVAVVAKTDRQKNLIEELNREIPNEKRIVYADSVAEITTMLTAARYYYFKVKEDSEIGIRGVTTFDITHIVKQIIDALGKASGVVDRLLPQLHQAARKFAEAA